MRALLDSLVARYSRITIVVGSTAAVLATLELFFNLQEWPALLALVRALAVLLVVAVLAESIVALLVARSLQNYLAARYGDLLVLVPALVLLVAGYPRGAGALVILRQAVVASLLLVRREPLRSLVTRLAQSPIRVLTLSFAAIIAVGTLFLTAPAATVDGRGADPLTALFMATSATCVTGLAVIDISTQLTRFGQFVILILVQVGGLGIMTLTTAFRLLFKSKLGLRERNAMAEVLEAADDMEFRTMVRRIVLLTAGLEATGALLLFSRLAAIPEVTGATNLWETAWLAVFHAVSAFCNAGFALWPDNLVRFVGDTSVNLSIMGLLVLGGLGFDVVAGLLRRKGPGLSGWWRGQSVHARIVLLATVGLIAGGTILYFFLEFDRSLRGLSLGDKLLASLFLSVTPRTAGFNTVDYAQMGPPALLLTMLLMYVGGSPGGTAGGVKTTTMVVLGLAVRAMVQRRADVEAFGRSLPRTVVYRAVTVTFISFFLISLFFGLLLQFQPGRFQDLLFECISAFATVGLSTGMTPTLNGPGRLVIIALMFVGRIGPFTLALAVGERGVVARYQYPVGKVVIG